MSKNKNFQPQETRLVNIIDDYYIRKDGKKYVSFALCKKKIKRKETGETQEYFTTLGYFYSLEETIKAVVRAKHFDELEQCKKDDFNDYLTRLEKMNERLCEAVKIFNPGELDLPQVEVAEVEETE